MTFQQLLFPFVFLPLAVLLFRVTPERFRKAALVLLSLIFIAWGNPSDLLFVGLSAVFNYFSGRELVHLRNKKQQQKARAVLISAVAANLLMLGYFKYTGFAARSLGALLHVAFRDNTMAAPMGVSFFTFSVLSFLFDLYRGRAEEAGSPLDFLLFVIFFPKFSSGPIIQYHEMAAQMGALRVTRGGSEAGVRTFLVGLFKKVLLADALGLVFDPISGLPAGELSLLTAWIGALSYSFMLYYDFSGYSDMALGLGRVFGFSLPVNFRYPYRSDSVADFWRRWHASLGAWFRDYVYIPMGGSRRGDLVTIRNLLTVWLLTGLWHGANWTFVVWGLYHGAWIILEKFVLKNLLPRIPAPVRRVTVFLIVMVGWVFFFSPDLASAFRYVGRLFAFGSLADSTALYYLPTALPLLAVSCFGAFPLVRDRGRALRKAQPRWFFPAEIAVFTLGFLLCVAGMVSATYTSFLYAQF